jgi:hypothetical protein
VLGAGRRGFSRRAGFSLCVCVRWELNGQIVLRLQPKPKATPRIKWADDTLDNENMGRKSSKCEPCVGAVTGFLGRGGRKVSLVKTVFILLLTPSRGCCIYKPPTAFGESSEESGEEPDDHNCFHDLHTKRRAARKSSKGVLLTILHPFSSPSVANTSARSCLLKLPPDHHEHGSACAHDH